MENQPFPSDVSAWTWDTVQSLTDSGQTENRYLEYKRHLQYPEGNTNKSETEWKRNVEREFTAFANASGGIIVFGVNDDGEPAPFEPPENEVSQTVSQLIQNTTPIPQTDVSDPLGVPSADTDRIALAVRVYEANRKPVATSDSAYYARINDQKQPMNREQIESLFVEADRRQQAIRQLEMEIDRFSDVYEEHFRDFSPHDSPPNFHLIDIESLRQVLRKNTHMYTNEDLKRIIRGVFNILRGIDSQERNYGRKVNGVVGNPPRDMGDFNREQQKDLRQKARRLYELLEMLTEQADLDAM